MKPCQGFFGPDRGKLQAQVDRLIIELKAREEGEPEVLQRYADQDSFAEIIDSLKTGSLFYPSLVLVLNRSEAMAAADQKLLQAYWKNPNSRSVLICLSEDSKAKDKFKFAAKDEISIFYEPDEKEKLAWLQNYFRKNQRQIDPEALTLLEELLLPDSLEMQKACDLLFSVKEKGIISAEDVETSIFHSRGENVYTLYEALLKLDLNVCLEIVQTILLAHEADPIQIVSGLQWQFRSFLKLKEAAGAGPADRNLMYSLRIMRPASQRIHNAALKTWKLGDLERRIRVLADYDRFLRYSKNPELELQLLIYQLVHNPNARFHEALSPNLFDVAWLD